MLICVMVLSLEIEKLQEEQQELQRRLNASESHAHKQSDSHDVQQLRALLRQYDHLKEELERERTSQAELKQEVVSYLHNIAHTV